MTCATIRESDGVLLAVGADNRIYRPTHIYDEVSDDWIEV